MITVADFRKAISALPDDAPISLVWGNPPPDDGPAISLDAVCEAEGELQLTISAVYFEDEGD